MKKIDLTSVCYGKYSVLSIFNYFIRTTLFLKSRHINYIKSVSTAIDRLPQFPGDFNAANYHISKYSDIIQQRRGLPDSNRSSMLLMKPVVRRFVTKILDLILAGTRHLYNLSVVPGDEFHFRMQALF